MRVEQSANQLHAIALDVLRVNDTEDHHGIVHQIVSALQGRQRACKLLIQIENHLRCLVKSIVSRSKEDVDHVLDNLYLAADGLIDADERSVGRRARARTLPSASVLGQATSGHLRDLIAVHQDVQSFFAGDLPSVPPQLGPFHSGPAAEAMALAAAAAGQLPQSLRSSFAAAAAKSNNKSGTASVVRGNSCAPNNSCNGPAMFRSSQEWLGSAESLLETSTNNGGSRLYGTSCYPSDSAGPLDDCCWPMEPLDMVRRSDRTKTSPANCVTLGNHSELQRGLSSTEYGTKTTEDFTGFLHRQRQPANVLLSEIGSGGIIDSSPSSVGHRTVSFSPECDNSKLRAVYFDPAQESPTRWRGKNEGLWLSAHNTSCCGFGKDVGSSCEATPVFSMLSTPTSAASSSPSTRPSVESDSDGHSSRVTQNSLEAHLSGVCKPCAFYYSRRKACAHGDRCGFCHHADHQSVSIKQWKKSQQATKYQGRQTAQLQHCSQQVIKPRMLRA